MPDTTVPNSQIAELMAQLTSLAFDLEGYGAAWLEQEEMIGSGGFNTVHILKQAPGYVLRRANGTTLTPEEKQLERERLAFLRSLKPHPFIDAPLIGHASTGSSSVTATVNKREQGNLFEYLVAMDRVIPRDEHQCILQDQIETAKEKYRHVTNKSFGLDDLRQILAQIVIALEVIYPYGYAHSDLKPPNILLSVTQDESGKKTYLTKLTDFDMINEPINKIKGSMYYLSPTLLDAELYKTPLNRQPKDIFADDIWALAVTILDCIAKPNYDEIFNHLRDESLLAKLPTLEARKKRWHSWLETYLACPELWDESFRAEQSLQSLLLQMLDFDENTRLTLSKLKESDFLKQEIAEQQAKVALAVASAFEIDPTTSPFKPLADEIRNLVANIIAIDKLSKNSREEVINAFAARNEEGLIELALSNRMKQILSLVGEILRKEKVDPALKQTMITLLTACKQPLLQEMIGLSNELRENIDRIIQALNVPESEAVLGFLNVILAAIEAWINDECQGDKQYVKYALEALSWAVDNFIIMAEAGVSQNVFLDRVSEEERVSSELELASNWEMSAQSLEIAYYKRSKFLFFQSKRLEELRQLEEVLRFSPDIFKQRYSTLKFRLENFRKKFAVTSNEEIINDSLTPGAGSSANVHP